MKAWKRCSIVVLLIMILLLSDGSVFCNYTDTERSTGNKITAFTSTEWLQTTLQDFQAGTASSVDLTTSPGNVMLARTTAGASVYAFVGGSSTTFLRYSVTSNSWSTMASAPSTIGDGASLVFDQSRYLYAFPGVGKNAFWRYDTTTNAWTVLSNTPGVVGTGGELVFGSTYIYALQGGTTALWRYTIASGVWSTLTTAPSAIGSGGSAVLYSGSLYIERGGNNRDFWSYTPSTNVWTTLTRTRSSIGAGGSLVQGPGDVFYALRGNNQRTFWSYDVSQNAWTTLSAAPARVNGGGSLAFDGSSSIYATQGGATSSYWRYSITGNTWTTLSSLTTVVNTGGCLVFATSAGAYASSGTLISAVRDTGKAGTHMTSISWDVNLPSGTSVTIEIRASNTLSGGVPSTVWTVVGNATSLWSLNISGQYVQWRATLVTTDTTHTPVLQEVRLYYFGG